MKKEEPGAYLLSLPRFTDQGAPAYRPGLERMNALMDGMGRPHEAFRSVHIAGTNGKGSTASMLAAVVSASGRKTGLHTSPHLFRLTERMRIDGQEAPEAWLADAVERCRSLFEQVGPSFFEATVALSFLYFAEKGVEEAVVEVGMGGRLDATNILTPQLSLITSIGFDHTEFLGDTLARIAAEKAGIVKPGVPVLTSAEQPEAVEAIRSAATARQAPFHHIPEEVRVQATRAVAEGIVLTLETPARRYENLRIGLPGLHQRSNAALALRAAELLPDPPPPEAVYLGLAEVRTRTGLRGRLDVLHRAPLIVADVGHNPEGLSAALRFVRSATPEHGRIFALFGALRDKDVGAMARLLAESGAAVFAVALASERALPAAELSDALRVMGVTISGAGPVPEGIHWFQGVSTPRDALLITGSHQVVAQIPEAWWT